MKMVKSLILGSAAGLVVMSGAQAADLPVKAKAVEYVRICSLYGAGFFYIPGTDTCIKLGGYLRAEVTIHGGNGNVPFLGGDGGMQDRYVNQYNDLARMAITVDTRTATEYGVVRTFGQFDTTFANSTSTSINTQSTTNTLTLNGQSYQMYVGGGATTAEFLFIQFAGFTFGKSASAFSTPWHGFPGNNTAYLPGGYDTVTGVNNVQYQAQFGNGVSATIGIDDSSSAGYNRTQIFNANLLPSVVGNTTINNAIPAAGGTNVAVTTATQLNGNLGLYAAPSGLVTGNGTAYGGAYVPDFVGNIRVDQAWGMFQLSGAVHAVTPGYWANANTVNASTFITGSNQVNVIGQGHPDTKFGGAINAALQIKNIPTGAGDDIKVEGTWGIGATKYVIGTAAQLPGSLYLTRGGPTTAGVIAVGAITDGVYGGFATPFQSEVQLTRGWGFRGAYNHNWDPNWSTSLFGGIANISYNDTAKNLWCMAYGSTLANGTAVTFNGARVGGAPATPIAGTGYTCDPGFTVSEIGLVTRWTPVKNLTFSTELLYAYLKTNMTGLASGTTSSAFPQPGGAFAVWQYGNVGTASVNFRAQRNF